MEVTLRSLRRKDHRLARAFAAEGMHFDWYFEKSLPLRLYSRYFWDLELTRATRVLAADCGGAFAGVLLCRMNGEKPACRSLWRSAYVRLFQLCQRALSKHGAGVYETANREMFRDYRARRAPDGELLFVAVDPALRGQGVGGFLLAELARRAPGKELYLYTDSACSYSFYERRGFERSGERDIVLELGGRRVPLRCFLYSRTL